MGQGLRFVQEYFLVACSLADLVRRFRRDNTDWSTLPEKVAIQLNDTHPSMAVPELMRILLDEAKLGWDEAWDYAKNAGVHQSHAVARSLEKWPVDGLNGYCRVNLEIIFEINRRLLDDVRTRFPGDEDGFANKPDRRGTRTQVRMANLAIVGSHSTNGVAAIHSQLLRTRRSRIWPKCFPSVSTTKPTASRPGAGCCWQIRALPNDHRRDRRRLDHRSQSIEQTETACR